MADIVDVELNKPGFIYIIQEATSDYFKVGVSTNEETLKQRISNLQSGNWRMLTLEQKNKVSNMKLAENYAHNLLRDVQVKEGGGKEWFKSSFETIKDAVDAAANEYPY